MKIIDFYHFCQPKSKPYYQNILQRWYSLRSEWETLQFFRALKRDFSISEHNWVLHCSCIKVDTTKFWCNFWAFNTKQERKLNYTKKIAPNFTPEWIKDELKSFKIYPNLEYLTWIYTDFGLVQFLFLVGIKCTKIVPKELWDKRRSLLYNRISF